MPQKLRGVGKFLRVGLLFLHFGKARRAVEAVGKQPLICRADTVVGDIQSGPVDQIPRARQKSPVRREQRR